MRKQSIAVSLSISQVERETGLSKDILRMWERRYAFPNPTRDANGERLYDAPQIDKLRTIKRLMDAGFRPGKLAGKSMKELAALSKKPDHANDSGVPDAVRGELVDLIKAHDRPALEAHLRQLLLRQGVQEFVLRTVAPLTTAVGNAWMRGEIAIFEEHLYTELLQSILRAAIQGLTGRRASPRVLLTTLPDEQHGLGLLMVEALLAADRVPCISLGTETPLQEIVVAAARHQADIVALSFSAGFPLRQAEGSVEMLRDTLETRTQLWVGGALAPRLKRLPSGIVRIPVLQEVIPAVATWHGSHPGRDEEKLT